MEIDQLHQLRDQGEQLTTLATRLRERSEVMEGLCEATKRADEDQEDIEEMLTRLVSEFNRVGREFAFLVEVYEEATDAVDMHETRLAELSDELDHLIDGCYDDSNRLLRTVSDMERELSRDSDMWRLVSQGKRQATRVIATIEDFTMPNALKRRIPEERELREPEEDSLEEQAEQIQEQVQNVQDMVDELLG